MKLRIADVRLCDGTGSPLREGALLMEDGVIAALGAEAESLPVDEVVSGNGAVLAPGFIDAHGHSDLSLMASPGAFARVSQGVTSEVAGNCGLSPFPLTAANRGHLQELWRNYKVKLDWSDYASYRAALKRRAPSVHLFSFCGHTTLRAAAAGYEAQKISPKQLGRMKTLLAGAMKQGALGLSTGLLYVPGKFASPEEIASLLEVVRDFDGMYATHLRSEGPRLIEAFDEAVAAVKTSGLMRLHVSHIKTAGAPNWGKLDELLAHIEAARADGVAVTADRYPYVEAMTQLSVIVPEEFEADDVALMRRLAVPGACEKLASAIRSERAPEYFRAVRLVAHADRVYESFLGQSLAAIARQLKLPPELLAAKLIASDAVGCSAAFRGMSGSNMNRLLACDWVVCGSDESSRPRSYEFGRSHPRNYGAVPRFLRLLLDSGVPLEKAVHRVTGMPAKLFSIPCRGVLAAGAAADLVLFDPAKLDGTEDYAHPHTPASGILKVWTSGVLRYAL